MNIDKLEQTLNSLVSGINKDTFVYDFLLAYELPQASITRLQRGDYNISKQPGEVLWKKRVCFRVNTSGDLHELIDSLQNDQNITKHHPRFIIVTDFKEFLAVDTKIKDSLDIQFDELHKHYDFFLPWAGMEKSQLQSENPADIKAAERMGKLYDLILEDNPVSNDAERHALNVFLSRLLFCFFAEDTGIFKDDQFINALASHTSNDGSDLQAYLQKLFLVLNTIDHSEFPKYLQEFPYVNGGLFAEDLPVPRFSSKSRKIILECGELNWKAINPDIFGSMIQAVIHEDMRGGLGMHYTSVTNIMKVIEPLFLNDLYEELEKTGENKVKLNALLDRIYHLKIFDPACGSGNFLIITYKELCKLEIEIFKRLYKKQMAFRYQGKIKLTQFYGIELDDFAHETAKLSMWLAEHQMNLSFNEIFGETKPTLPLQDGGNVVRGNAVKINWDDVCPNTDNGEVFIIGNPPYLGARNQNKEQKDDLRTSLKRISGVNSLDYISCWFYKAALYMKNTRSQCAFVTTNSLCQGEQVGILWPHILSDQLEISFVHQSFKWTNNAKNNAGVTCMVVGLRAVSSREKYIYSNGTRRQVRNISPYGLEGDNIFISKRTSPLFKVPQMVYGNQPVDGGFLKLSMEDRNKLLSQFPESERYIRKMIGGSEFLKGDQKWCLWIEDEDLEDALNIAPIRRQIENVREARRNGGEVAKSLVERSHQFRYRHEAKKMFILLPRTSSENRSYLPVGFFDKEYISLESAQVLYDSPPYIFAILSSRIHMVWVRTVAGRLKTDYRYSNGLCYNNFPFPNISDSKKSILEEQVYRVLDERELHSEKSIAQLYDPKKMPKGLLKAHEDIDQEVEQCYRSKPFESDEERLEYLFKLYQETMNA